MLLRLLRDRRARLLAIRLGILATLAVSGVMRAAEALPSSIAEALRERARHEPDAEVRAQLAATARRLPVAQALPIADALLRRDEDARDPYIPLLCWWVLEHHLTTNRAEVLALFDDQSFWERTNVFEHILPRLMRRFATEGRRQDLLICAQLLRAAPSAEHTGRLLKGFEEAYRGRPMVDLPEELISALAQAGRTPLLLRLRRGDPEAETEALKILRDAHAKSEDRALYARVLGELKLAPALPDLLALATNSPAVPVRQAALAALGAFDEAAIAPRVVESLGAMPEGARPAAFSLLASRAAWAGTLLRAVEAGRVPVSMVSAEVAERLRTHPDQPARALALKLFPKADLADGDFPRRLRSVESALRGGAGDPYRGEGLFMQRCAACHKLFFKGGSVGPDLTPYQRDNLGTLLVSILNPNAEIREGYAAVEVETKDGRRLSGFVTDRDANVVVVRTLGGENATLRHREVESLEPTGRSLMPEGLLDGWSDQQLRDFFAYLRISQPMTR